MSYLFDILSCEYKIYLLLKKDVQIKNVIKISYH